MEIHKLKQKLDILEVATHLGIQINKNQRALCPFHNDKTPSLQFSKEKQIATCFSSKCNLGTVDIIGLTERKLNVNTHEALKYLTALANGATIKAAATIKTEKTVDYQSDFETMQSTFLSSSTARNYVESRKLNRETLQIGYNAFKNGKFDYLRGCIVFPMKDKEGKIVSLYGRSVRNNDKAKHYYTANRKGLYPNYPPAGTTKLILTEAIIDAVTLLQIPEIKEKYEILSLYGTNGLTEEHTAAISQLQNLQEIIFFFDGDEAGIKATSNYEKILKKLRPEIQLSSVVTPDNEDINSLSIGHNPEIFDHLINQRLPLLKKVENCVRPLTEEVLKDQLFTKQNPSKSAQSASSAFQSLNVSNPYKITYTTENAIYHIKGGLPKALDSLKITLEIENLETGRKSRTKPDLYEDKQVEKISREAGEKLGIRPDLIELDLSNLTDLLDEYREQQLKENQPDKQTQKPQLNPMEQQKAIQFLKQKELIKKFNKLIEKAGITGEENNRIFLFVIATSYKMPDTLHALIQGSSGSGKTYLSRQITDLMPKEDVIRLTRVTESSFYNYGEYEIQHKLIVLEDIDGLKEEAEYAFRELQSNGEIISSTSVKDENSGNIRAQIRKVKGPIGSIATTTRGEIYEDNMSRIFLLAVDESRSQTDLIIKYQNQKSAGMVNKSEEYKTRDFVQNCIRILKPYEVINPYANKILLPPEAHKIRRLTELYHAFINQITLLNQYQRKRDKQGRLITEKEDIQTAIEIMFDSIILKIDELDGSLRQFYEDLKDYIQKQGSSYAKASDDEGNYQNYQFTQREIRQELKISKTQIYRHFTDLLNLEYITQTGGYSNRGFKYKITYWDDIKALRDRIKTYLNKQLELL